MLDRTKTEKKISQIKLQMVYDINERLRGLKVATLAEFVVPYYYSGPISANQIRYQHIVPRGHRTLNQSTSLYFSLLGSIT